MGYLALYFHGQYVRLSKTVEKVRIFELEKSVAENIIKNYSGGVCFIQGSFYFYDEETNEPIFSMGREGMKGYNEYTGTGVLGQ